MKLNQTLSRKGPLASVRLWQLSMIVAAMVLTTLLTATATAGAAGSGGPAAPSNLQADPGNAEVHPDLGRARATQESPDTSTASGKASEPNSKDWVSFGGATHHLLHHHPG